MFLYIDPLKQGLKLGKAAAGNTAMLGFYT